MIRFWGTLLILVVSVTASVVKAAPAASPDAILKATDDIRNPAQSYVMQVTITDSEENSTYKFEVSVKGKSKTLIKTLSPKREEGKSFLMLGEDMWVSIPNMKRAVRVSLNQKLVGEAANGDLARMRWYGDYEPTIESETANQWVLNLQANKKGLTYEKIRLHVSKAGSRPLRAYFMTSSGKIFKTLAYKDFRKLAGIIRPGTLEITNATTQVKSTVKILNVKTKNLPDSLFNQNNLP